MSRITFTSFLWDFHLRVNMVERKRSGGVYNPQEKGSEVHKEYDPQQHTTRLTSTYQQSSGLSGMLLGLMLFFESIRTTSLTSATFSGVRDFCIADGFQASCVEGEVIIMTIARYGRMRLGSCVLTDYGYVGCATDVLPFLSRSCSGQQSCHIGNMEKLLTGPLACPRDLKPYLEASWECRKVVQGNEELCNYGFLNVPGRLGYLASLTTEEHGFGSSRCPWVIKGLPGQRINITLMDYGHVTRSSQSVADPSGHLTKPRYCRGYGLIREASKERSLVVCDGDPPEKHSYVSHSHVLEVQMERSETPPGGASHFLLRYEVVGCALPELPTNTRSELKGDSLVVRCNFTKEVWSLECVDGSWRGVIGNCSAVVAGMDAIQEDHSFVPLGLTLLIILGVAIMICVITLVVGLVHFRRRKRQEEARKQDALLYGTPRAQHIKLDSHLQQHQTQLQQEQLLPQQHHRFATIDRHKHYTPVSGRMCTTAAGGGGEYSHIWEVRRPLPVGVVTVPQVVGDTLQRQQGNKVGSGPPTLPKPKPGMGHLIEGSTHLPSCGYKECGKDPASFRTFKPSDDHIYQSPTMARQRKQDHPCHPGTHPHPGGHDLVIHQPPGGHDPASHATDPGSQPTNPALHPSDIGSHPHDPCDPPFYFELDPKAARHADSDTLEIHRHPNYIA